jgi:hypothetical protein
MKAFSDEWHALINYFVSGGSVAIKVNDNIGRYFQTLLHSYNFFATTNHFLLHWYIYRSKSEIEEG